MEFQQQQRVLADINLDITRGQTVVVIGESGCGKTVLLKLMIGLLRPTSGVVTFDVAPSNGVVVTGGFQFDVPVPTIVGRRYFVSLETNDPYGIGLTVYLLKKPTGVELNRWQTAHL